MAGMGGRRSNRYQPVYAMSANSGRQQSASHQPLAADTRFRFLGPAAISNDTARYAIGDKVLD